MSNCTLILEDYEVSLIFDCQWVCGGILLLAEIDARDGGLLSGAKGLPNASIRFVYGNVIRSRMREFKI